MRPRLPSVLYLLVVLTRHEAETTLSFMTISNLIHMYICPIPILACSHIWSTWFLKTYPPKFIIWMSTMHSNSVILHHGNVLYVLNESVKICPQYCTLSSTTIQCQSLPLVWINYLLYNGTFEPLIWSMHWHVLVLKVFDNSWMYSCSGNENDQL